MEGYLWEIEVNTEHLAALCFDHLYVIGKNVSAAIQTANAAIKAKYPEQKLVVVYCKFLGSVYLP